EIRSRAVLVPTLFESMWRQLDAQLTDEEMAALHSTKKLHQIVFEASQQWWGSLSFARIASAGQERQSPKETGKESPHIWNPLSASPSDLLKQLHGVAKLRWAEGDEGFNHADEGFKRLKAQYVAEFLAPMQPERARGGGRVATPSI